MSKERSITAIPNVGKVKFKCNVCHKESPEYDMPASVADMNEMAVAYGQNHKKCKRLLGNLK